MGNSSRADGAASAAGAARAPRPPRSEVAFLTAIIPALDDYGTRINNLRDGIDMLANPNNCFLFDEMGIAVFERGGNGKATVKYFKYDEAHNLRSPSERAFFSPNGRACIIEEMRGGGAKLLFFEKSRIKENIIGSVQISCPSRYGIKVFPGGAHLAIYPRHDPIRDNYTGPLPEFFIANTENPEQRIAISFPRHTGVNDCNRYKLGDFHLYVHLLSNDRLIVDVNRRLYLLPKIDFSGAGENNNFILLESLSRLLAPYTETHKENEYKMLLSPNGQYLAVTMDNRKMFVFKVDDTLQNVRQCTLDGRGSVYISFSAGNMMWGIDNSLIFRETSDKLQYCELRETTGIISEIAIGFNARYVRRFRVTDEGTLLVWGEAERNVRFAAVESPHIKHFREGFERECDLTVGAVRAATPISDDLLTILSSYLGNLSGYVQRQQAAAGAASDNRAAGTTPKAAFFQPAENDYHNATELNKRFSELFYSIRNALRDGDSKEITACKELNKLKLWIVEHAHEATHQELITQINKTKAEIALASKEPNLLMIKLEEAFEKAVVPIPAPSAAPPSADLGGRAAGPSGGGA